jgi:D-3-phosphoglycerate dehydrogenase / 2-oxoglutarate reductase
LKPKILIGTSSFGKQNHAPSDLLERSGLEVLPNPYGRKLTHQELLALLPGVDGLLAGLETIDRDILTASDLKVVSRCGSGISNVNVDACKELGIVFKSTPYGPTQAVAELTLAMIINLLRHVWPMHAALCKGKWDKHVGFQLKGKTVCIVGFGKIGRCTAALLEPFKVNLIAVDPCLDPDKETVLNLDLTDALPLSDIMVLHAGGEDEILGNKEFALLKRGAFLCNAARGQNVNETALLKALASGKIAGAWLDSFSTEPYNGPLCVHPKVILTPHVGSYTQEGRLNMEIEAAQNLIDGLQQKG